MKRSVVILVAALVVTAMLIARFQTARSLRASASAAPAALGFTGQQAPDFALQSLDGKTVRLSDFRGKVVVLNFWATWCQPCKIEMPWFEQLQKQYQAQGIQVIGIAMDDPTTDAGKADVASFARNLGVDYPVLLGKEDGGRLTVASSSCPRRSIWTAAERSWTRFSA